MTDIFLRKVAGGARPADENSFELIKGISNGTVLKVTAPAQGERIVRQRRLYWSLLTKVHEATDRWSSPKALHVVVKILLGYCDLIELPDGEIIRNPQSTAVEAMSAAEFRVFLNQVIDLVVTVIIPDLDRADLGREILEMVGAP